MATKHKFLLLQLVNNGKIEEVTEDMGQECNIMVKGEYILELYKWYKTSKITINRKYQRKY